MQSTLRYVTDDLEGPIFLHFDSSESSRIFSFSSLIFVLVFVEFGSILFGSYSVLVYAQNLLVLVLNPVHEKPITVVFVHENITVLTAVDVLSILSRRQGAL